MHDCSMKKKIVQTFHFIISVKLRRRSLKLKLENFNSFGAFYCRRKPFVVRTHLEIDRQRNKSVLLLNLGGILLYNNRQI